MNKSKQSRNKIHVVAGKAKDVRPEPQMGDRWLNLISGCNYIWDGKVWRSTGKYPYGPNPMGFLGDGVSDGPVS